MYTYEAFIFILRALKGLNATNSQHFGTANFPANVAAVRGKLENVRIALYCLYQ